MPKIIGIDLGTTNSVVAVFEGGQAKVLQNRHGSRGTPSVVGFTEKGERVVGQQAKHQQITNPLRTVSSIKRFIGRRRKEVANEERMVPYAISGAPDEFVTVTVGEKQLTPSEISAMILQDLKQTAEEYLGESVESAVITVPAYFNDSQRQATKDAGEIAGLKVERIVNEPTAAALAYGLDKKKEQTILVFDLGGGTFDVSILHIDPEVGSLEVLAVSGDTCLGGDDYDNALIDFIADDFRAREGVDLRQDPMALQRLKEAAEKSKCELSSLVETTINLPFITATSSGPKHLQITILRSQFDKLTAHLTERCQKPIMDALEGAKLDPHGIDEVVLVGGSTRIPAVQHLVRSIFEKEPNKGINPDEVVALGAAIQASVLGGDMQDMVLLDVTPLTVGVETLGGLMTPLIEANTTIPTSRTETFSTAADGQTEVTIHVLQGNREVAGGNRSLGRFNLEGILPAPRGLPQIDVTFDIDRNGILRVSARDKGTGKEHSIRIEGSGGLSTDEIAKMRKEAEQNMAQDRQTVEFAKLRNTCATLCHQAEVQLRENVEKFAPDLKGKIEESLKALRSAIQSLDPEGLKKAQDRLAKDLQELGEIVYKGVRAKAGQPVS